jgi:C-terminal processing protease CtpA/Prc
VKLGGARAERTFELENGTTPLVRLRSFDKSDAQALDAFVASAPKLRDARALVVDVRANGGGDDSFATSWFVKLTRGHLSYPTIDRLDSEVTLQGDVNMATCELARGDGDPGGRSFAETFLGESRATLDRARREHGKPFRAWSRRAMGDDGAAPKPFRAPLVALVDNGCASSCESFVQYVPQLERGLVVGENTGGVGVFGEVRPYRLPNSGLGMSAGRKYFHDPDPARIAPEGRGRLPDLWLDTSDAPALATKIAECLAKPDCALVSRAAVVKP